MVGHGGIAVAKVMHDVGDRGALGAGQSEGECARVCAAGTCDKRATLGVGGGGAAGEGTPGAAGRADDGVPLGGQSEVGPG